MIPNGFEDPEAGWAVYRTVSGDFEKVLSEEPFSLRENCEKQAEELTRKSLEQWKAGTAQRDSYICGREDLRSPIRHSKR